MAVTTLNNLINPEVMRDMISAKIEAQAKFTPYAKLDTTLQGVEGDTVTVPSWNYIGDAEDYDVEGGEGIDTANLSAGTTQFTIKTAAKGLSIYQTAINSGKGKPVAQAEAQLAKSISNKLDNDILAAALTSKNVVTGANAINYAGIVNANAKFEDEEDGIEKVMFIHPNQEAQLLVDPSFISADKFEAGVAVRGSIGKIAGCWIKKSKKVTAEGGYYNCPIIKLEADSADTEYTEDELPALTVFLKKDTDLTHEFYGKYQRHDFYATKYYGVALTNEAKVVVAKFKETATQA